MIHGRQKNLLLSFQEEQLLRHYHLNVTNMRKVKRDKSDENTTGCEAHRIC